MSARQAAALLSLVFALAAVVTTASAAVDQLPWGGVEIGLLVASGVAAYTVQGRAGNGRAQWPEWQVAEFEVDCASAIPIGVDGEALELASPLRFVIRPGALRVRIAPHHPGVSPSAHMPSSLAAGLHGLLATARGRDRDEGIEP